MAVDKELLDFVEQAVRKLVLPPDFELRMAEHPGGSIYVYAGMDTIRISNHDQRERRDYGNAPIADIRVKRRLGRTAERQVRTALRRAIKNWISTPD